MWREVSSTSPWPAVWPARLVPAPRRDDRHARSARRPRRRRRRRRRRAGRRRAAARSSTGSRRSRTGGACRRRRAPRRAARAPAPRPAPPLRVSVRVSSRKRMRDSLPCIGDDAIAADGTSCRSRARRTSRTAFCGRSTRRRSTTAGRTSPASASRSSRACAGSSRRAARSSSTPPPAPARGRRRSSTRCRPATACSRSRPATSRRCGGRWPSGSGSRSQWVEGDWRHGADPERAAEILAADANRDIRAVMVVHNETSTGVTSRIPEIRAAIDAAGHDALLLVDVDLLARLDRLPPRGVGRRRHRRRLAEGPDAAGRAQLQRGQPEGARRRRARADAALLLGLGADHRGQRDRLLALHVGDEPALRPARGAGDAAARGGALDRLRPPRAPRRGDARGGRGVGPRGAGARPARALRRC